MGSFSYTSCTSWGLFCFLILRSFSYTSRAGFIFVWGVSFTHPVMASFFCGIEFLLQIPCWFLFFFFIWGVSLTHPVFCFCFMWGASLVCSLLWRQTVKKRAGWKMAQICLTHPVLASWCGEFLLHVPWTLVAALCWDFPTRPMDVLTLPTAYQNKTNKQTKKGGGGGGGGEEEEERFLFLWKRK